jgi:hypothetical protein
MGKVVQEFNPFDPLDPMYETSANAIESAAMGEPDGTQYAGTNFYEDRDMGKDSLDDEINEVQDEKPISPAELEFEEIL